MGNTRNFKLLVGLLACLPVTSCKTSNSSHNKETLDPLGNRNSLDLGIGYDFIKQEPVADCVTGETGKSHFPEGGISSSAGQSIFAEMKLLEKSTKTTSDMGFSAAASGVIKFITLGLVGSFQKKLTQQDYIGHLALWINVSNGSERLYNLTLTKAAQEALDFDLKNAQNGSKNSSFFKMCGDRYVSSKVTGGELLVLFSVKANSKNSSTDIKAALEAAAKTVKGDYGGKFSFTSSLSKALSQYEVDASYMQVGGTGESFELNNITIDDVLKNIDKFPEEVRSRPVTISLDISDYTTVVPSLSTDKSYARLVMDQNIKRMRADQNRAKDYIDQIRVIVENVDEYPSAKIDLLKNQMNNINAILEKVTLAEKACIVDFDRCDYSPEAWNNNLSAVINDLAGYRQHMKVIHSFELKPNDATCFKAADSQGEDFNQAPMANVYVVFSTDHDKNVNGSIKVRMDSLKKKELKSCEATTEQQVIYTAPAGWKVDQIEMIPHKILSNAQLAKKVQTTVDDPLTKNWSYVFKNLDHDYTGEFILTGDSKGKDFGDKEGNKTLSARIYGATIRGTTTIRLINTNPNPAPSN